MMMTPRQSVETILVCHYVEGGGLAGEVGTIVTTPAQGLRGDKRLLPTTAHRRVFRNKNI